MQQRKEGNSMLDMKELLAFSVEAKASDVHIAVGIPPAAVFLNCHRVIILDGIAAGLLLREFLSQLGAVHTVELGRVIEETAAVIIRLNDAVQISVKRFSLAQQVC